MWNWTNHSSNPNFQTPPPGSYSPSHFTSSSQNPATLLPFPGYHDYTLSSLSFPNNQRLHSSQSWSHPLEGVAPHIQPNSLQHHMSTDVHKPVHHPPELATVISNSNPSLQLPAGPGGSTVVPEPSGYHQVTNNRPFSVDFLLQKNGSPNSDAVGYGNTLHISNEQYSNDQSNYTAMDYHHSSSNRSFDALSSYHGPHLPHVEPRLQNVEPNLDNSLTPPTISHRPYNQSESSKQFNESQYSISDYSQSTDDGISLALPPTEEPYSPPELIVKDDNSALKVQEDSNSNGLVLESDEVNNITSGGFQLGLSPPSVPEPPKSLVNEKYESSNSSDEEGPHPLVPDPPMEVSKLNLSPPPLVPMETIMPQPKKSKIEEDDDVFLPLANRSPSSTIETVGGASNDAISKDDDGNNTKSKSPMMVIGRRGRAAGKVLDESKLRVPLDKGWQRVVRARVTETNASPRVDICYVTPCNRRLRTFPEIQRYLISNNITDLTVDHFTFSKKVNVGVVIDENAAIEGTDSKLLQQPRRGRPPKQTNLIKQQVNEVSYHNDLSRISLEPYEIKQAPELHQVSMVTVSPTRPFSSYFTAEEPHTITKVVNEISSETVGMEGSDHVTDHVSTAMDHVTSTSSSVAPSVNHVPDHMTPSPKNLPPSHVTTPSNHMTPSAGHMTPPAGHMTPPAGHMTPSTGHLTPSTGHLTPSSSHMTPSTDQMLPKALPPLLLSDSDNVESKKSRGRPKGKGKSDSNGVIQLGIGRKGRKPKHIMHFPPTSVSDQQITNDITTVSGATEANEDEVSKQVMKTQANTSKRHQILPANKVKKRTNRRGLQQTKRQREKALIKQAKEHLERVNKQKEAEWHQLRKSRLAKQKEEQNQIRARQRTLKLVEEIQQKEQERDRILRLRQLEMQKAEQLRKPTEDLLVNDLISLPQLTKINWIQVPSNSFAELVMIFEFCHSFEDFLELESVPKFPEVYRGLFNYKKEATPTGDTTNSLYEPVGIMKLVVHLVKAVVHDGMHKCYTLSGQSLKEIEVREDTVSEILRLYLVNKHSRPLKQICNILEEYPFHSLRPVDKIAVLSFLVDELLNSTSLCREIDNRMEQISTLRRDKWKISLKLKRFRSRLTDTFGVQTSNKPIVYSGRGRPPKRAFLNNGIEDVDSSDEEGVANEATTDEPLVDDEVYYSEEDTDEDIPTEKEDLQKRVKELKKKFVLVRSRIYNVTRLMRKFPLGQDRYTRQYWNLPEMGGVLIEGMETTQNEYLEMLFPLLEEKEKENSEDITPNTLSPSYESRGTSEVPQSLQSSPHPPLQHDVTSEKSHPLEIQQFAKNNQDNVETNLFDQAPSHPQTPPLIVESAESEAPPTSTPVDLCTHVAPPTSSLNSDPTTSSSSAPPITKSSSTTKTSYDDDMLWFSLLPRKPCELLHFIQNSSDSQQGATTVGGQYMLPGGYAAYMTSDGTTVLSQPLVQQIQVGYAVVGNTLVPQTQYVISQNPVAAVGGNQYVSLGNGQVAVATGGGASNVQYANIGGSQYAIIQQPQEESETVVEKGDSRHVSELEHGGQSSKSEKSEQKKKKKKPKDDQPAETGDTQQMITLAIPTGSSGEAQYVQLPADPRVLSGQCSYAIMPQGDGTSQIVLVENSSLASNGGDHTTNNDVIELECPAASLLENEYESHQWMVDITLMYADAPLPFMGNEKVVEEKIEDKTPLKDLLEDISKDLTQGWWTITSSSDIDHLLRCLTLRGYREKSLHKLLQKNKDNICAMLKPDLLTTPPLMKAEGSTQKEEEVMEGEEVTEEEEEMMEEVTKEGEEIDRSHDIESHDIKEEIKEEVDVDKQEVPVIPVAMETDTPTDSVVIESEVSSEDLFYPMESNKMATQVIEYVKAMEIRLFDAHLQNKDVIREIYFSKDEQNISSNDTSISEIANHVLRFESCVQRRYLKPPFIDKHIARAKSSSAAAVADNDSSGSPPPDSVALIKWRNAISQSISVSQLAVYINQLEKCIAWEKSPMKVFCVVCQTGDNESLLLLCDRCDRGTHTYCCRPKLDTIPEGNWYCHNCTINASRKTVCGVCQSGRGTLLHCTQCPKVYHKRCLNPPLTKIPNMPWVCSDCRYQQRRKPGPGRPRVSKDDLLLCQAMLMELEDLDDAWPFLEPVNRRKIPDYYRVIKRPMDFQTIKQKLQEGKYSNKESFATDIRLVFDNCSYYNEDDSEIGMAGHAMRQYFERKWNEMMY